MDSNIHLVLTALYISSPPIAPAISGRAFGDGEKLDLIIVTRWFLCCCEALLGILGPCSSCVPIREPWLMWPALAFHLGSPLLLTWLTQRGGRPQTVLGSGPRGRACPPILLIDSWSSHSARACPQHISSEYDTRSGAGYPPLSLKAV